MTEQIDDKVQQLTEQLLDRIEELEEQTKNPVQAIAEIIQLVVNDPCLAPSVIRRAAREADKKQERLDDLARLLARTALAFQRGEVRSPAGYFGSSVKRLAVHKWGVNWMDEPAPRTSGRRSR